ncbi:hypothetical protein ACJIZ3_014386 [Penstemon smallii]|uniref:Helitron helicase-like domain-containing protein n=1 Tax=Penstemon smallii TaxID=265156 RepID=A0ABD3RJS5_9LAMI
MDRRIWELFLLTLCILILLLQSLSTIFFIFCFFKLLQLHWKLILFLSDSGIVSSDAALLDNHAKAHLRYASMDPVEKSTFLSKCRAQYALRQSRSSSSEVTVSSRGHFDRINNIPVVVWSLTQQDPCCFCGAFRFYREPPGFCCCSGSVVLAMTVFSPILWFLFTDPHSKIACVFHRKNRSYNHAFAFSSIGMAIDPDSWWARKGVYALKVLGKANLTNLLQLFFLDSVDDANDEVLEYRDLRRDVMALLMNALADNPYGKFFRHLRSWDNLGDASIVIRTSPALDQRNCNVPTVDDVASVWKDGDEDEGRTHKFNYYYSCYNPLQYLILFPNGEPGWHAGIAKKMLPKGSLKHKEPCLGLGVVDVCNMGSADKMFAMEEEGDIRYLFFYFFYLLFLRSNVSCREYSCYQFQIRTDHLLLLHTGRLGHEFIIDIYIKLKTSHLDYYRSEQTQRELRTESYQGIVDSAHVHGQNDHSSIGRRIILPSSFIGGPRDMRKCYINAMSLVQKILRIIFLLQILMCCLRELLKLTRSYVDG